MSCPLEAQASQGHEFPRPRKQERKRVDAEIACIQHTTRSIDNIQRILSTRGEKNSVKRVYVRKRDWIGSQAVGAARLTHQRRRAPLNPTVYMAIYSRYVVYVLFFLPLPLSFAWLETPLGHSDEWTLPFALMLHPPFFPYKHATILPAALLKGLNYFSNPHKWQSDVEILFHAI